MQIDDRLMQMEKCKSQICFSHVLPKSASGDTDLIKIKLGLGDISKKAETTTSESSKMDADMNMPDSFI